MQTRDEWAELFYQYKVSRGIHPGPVLAELEDFQLWVSRSSGDPTLPRTVTRERGYIIVELDGTRWQTRGIFCRLCRSISFHMVDVEKRYCGRCKTFHEDAIKTPYA